jgi:hypothetical protein
MASSEWRNGERGLRYSSLAIRTRTHSRDASASELFRAVARMSVSEIRATNKGKRSADRRIQPCPRGALRCCHLKALRARKRPDVGGPLAFRRSTTALAGATERSNSAQAALRANERTQALSAPSITLKRCTSCPGRSAGGDDARAARERSYELRPQEPHSLHRSAVAGDVPIERDSHV